MNTEQLITLGKRPQEPDLEQAEAAVAAHSALNYILKGDLDRGTGNSPLAVGITYAPILGRRHAS
jgi:hypothetical protein